uniref:MTOR-associated protein MEAK7 n=2 Tax=Lygus hesperus TaxID=30085 RepID=A0A0K8SIH1_LYGHE
MGLKKSKENRNEVTAIAALVNFTEKEWMEVSLYFKLDGKGSHGVNNGVFQEIWRETLTPSLSDCWIRYVFYEGQDSFDKARFTYLFKGQTSLLSEYKTKAVYRVITNTAPKGAVKLISYERLAEYIFNIMVSYLRSLWHYRNHEFVNWLRKDATASTRTLKTVNKVLLEPLQKTVDNMGMVEIGTVEDFLRSSRVVSEMIDGLLEISYGTVDIATQPSLLPNVHPRMSTVMDVGEVLFLSSHLMKIWAQHWKLRFHNKGHGSNFTMLCEMISDVGPTIIVVKDTSGHVFGCCATDSWKPASFFYGDCRCFLFQLKPHLRYYPATTFNTNFQYHNQNQHMLPNGFGMGGRIGSWGFWLDGDFGKGLSAGYCSTFKDYSRLSGKEEFTYDHIEVWSIDESDDLNADQDDPGSIRKKSKSIIENQQLKNALLTMAGREPHSS